VANVEQPPPPPVVVSTSPWFSRILVALLLLTFVCLGLWVGLALGLSEPTPSQSDLIEGVSKAFTGCLGAFFGLIGGKFS
jgi:hypothetical protein